MYPDSRVDLAPAAISDQARAFGIVNAAYHLSCGLNLIEALLGRRLPPLTVRIGMHGDQPGGWGGGHYRLPATSYSELPEADPPNRMGEIHLGPGRRFVRHDAVRYFHAPAHNAAILYHELGHHLCRHTADFRLNRRPVLEQGNRKIPLEEGTCDYLAGMFLGFPDIFGWHRADFPAEHQSRRRLDAGWIMEAYVGGSKRDPHLDGTVWSNALWATRSALVAAGVPASIFDRIVVRALDRIGTTDADVEWNEALRRRRHLSQALAAMLEMDRADGTGCGDLIEKIMWERGILLGRSNASLRDHMRASSCATAVSSTADVRSNVGALAHLYRFRRYGHPHVRILVAGVLLRIGGAGPTC